MQELLPIASGVAIGVFLGLLRPSLRLGVGAALAILFGVLATVVTGEYLISWEFLLVDIPLVAAAAGAALFAVHRVRSAATLKG